MHCVYACVVASSPLFIRLTGTCLPFQWIKINAYKSGRNQLHEARTVAPWQRHTPYVCMCVCVQMSGSMHPCALNMSMRENHFVQMKHINAFDTAIILISSAIFKYQTAVVTAYAQMLTLANVRIRAHTSRWITIIIYCIKMRWNRSENDHIIMCVRVRVGDSESKQRIQAHTQTHTVHCIAIFARASADNWRWRKEMRSFALKACSARMKKKRRTQHVVTLGRVDRLKKTRWGGSGGGKRVKRKIRWNAMRSANHKQYQLPHTHAVFIFCCWNCEIEKIHKKCKLKT